MGKRLAIVAFLLSLMLLVSGCVTVDQHLIVRSNGTADLEVSMLMPESLWQMAKSSPGNSFDDMRRDITSSLPDAQVSEVSGNGQGGIKVRRSYKSVQDAIRDITSGTTMNAAAGERSPRSSSAFFTDVQYKTVGGRTVFSATTDSSVLQTAIRNSQADADVDLSSVLSLKFSITVPYKIEEARGAEISDDGYTATWTVPLNEDASFELKTVPHRTIPIWLWGVFVVVLVAAVAFVVLRRRSQDVAW